LRFNSFVPGRWNVRFHAFIPEDGLHEVAPFDDDGW